MKEQPTPSLHEPKPAAPSSKLSLQPSHINEAAEFGQVFSLRSLYRAIQFCQGFPNQKLLMDDTQLYKLFVENEGFKRELGDLVFAMTSR